MKIGRLPTGGEARFHMATRLPLLVDSDSKEILQELARIQGSAVLHGAEALCKLLGVLVKHTLEHPGESLKEYHIGTTLLGRHSEFDPRVDPSVRVQVGRLRSKLIEYYATEG